MNRLLKSDKCLRVLSAFLSRYVLLFFLCFMVLGPLLLGLLDYVYPFSELLAAALGMKVPLNRVTEGSGDSSLNYTLLCFDALVAFFGAGIWSALRGFQDLRMQTLRVYHTLVRYYLAVIFWVYGCSKLFKSQFPDASLMSLSQPVGELSPMGLAWTYMGYSYVYNLFTGTLECLGGLLLFFPHTVLLGSLLNVGVMGHVFVMNLSFDIPVKINSGMYVLMSLWLLWPHRHRLWEFFIGNQLVGNQSSGMPLSKRLLKWGLVGLFMGAVVWGEFTYSPWLHPKPIDPDVVGVYQILVHSSSELTHVTATWQQIVFDFPHQALVRTADDSLWVAYYVSGQQRLDLFFEDQNQYYFVDLTYTHGKKTVFKGQACPVKAEDYSYDKVKKTHVYHREQLLANCPKSAIQTFQFAARRKRKSDYLLINRGFHWINETPFNL